MSKKIIYSIHYRLNDEEQFERIEASRCPPSILTKTFNSTLVDSLKRIIRYDSSSDKLDILGIEPAFK